ncbi:MAG: orotidine-5'-phosphate decarboxylase [Streptococcaceae bacterium]|jgi:orotidine-5'-phosphate decarboxylase|nr:orotidine-5'-phosphate decarboxylase [Streptococcaceae bacterium]
MGRDARESRPVIALDFPNKMKLVNFLAKFPVDERLFVKIGMEIFYQEGTDIVKFLKDLGHFIFLDLKLHDIPNTVKSVMRCLAKLGVNMTNVHAAGGIKMMEAACHGLIEGTLKDQKIPKLIAVTQLTSISEKSMKKEQLISVSLKESVVNYAQNAKKAGLDGVVCSALEVEKIKAKTAADFICLTPGIRPMGESANDQQRVLTPSKARKLGSDYIVVGRAITQAKKPYQAYQRIKEEWNKKER